jgi:hypothetical protein
MTCNPIWDEINNELYHGETPQDRPDLVARVSRAKLEVLKKKLMKNDILGKVRAYICCGVTEKRIAACALFANHEKKL